MVICNKHFSTDTLSIYFCTFQSEDRTKELLTLKIKLKKQFDGNGKQNPYLGNKTEKI